jgi:hypothetical protein
VAEVPEHAVPGRLSVQRLLLGQGRDGEGLVAQLLHLATRELSCVSPESAARYAQNVAREWGARSPIPILIVPTRGLPSLYYPASGSAPAYVIFSIERGSPTTPCCRRDCHRLRPARLQSAPSSPLALERRAGRGGTRPTTRLALCQLREGALDAAEPRGRRRAGSLAGQDYANVAVPPLRVP